MTEDPCKDCKIHGRIEESIDNVKSWKDKIEEWQKSVTNSLENMVTAKAAWAFFVVFLSVALGVVGFLWRGQIAIWDKVVLDHKETMQSMNKVGESLNEMDKKLTLLDYKVQSHLDEGKKK